MGSVARGDAITGESDIDFLALVRRLDDPARDALHRRAALLGATYPVVSRADLDASPVERLAAFQRFVLSSDALCLRGRDTRTRPLQALPRGSLARLVTPDLGELVTSYRGAAQQAKAASELRFYGRVTGKDLLKGLRAVALLRGGEYERSSERIFRQAVALVPEHADLAGELYRLYCQSDPDRDHLLRVLAAVEARLLPDLERARFLGARDE